MSEKENPKNRAWLRPFLKPILPVFREVMAMSAFVNLLALATPVFTMQVYDRVISHAGITTLQGLVIGMILVMIFDFILRQARSRIMQRVALRVDVEVGRRLFNKVMELPLQHLENKPASFWQTLFRDVDTIRNTLSGASAILIFDLPFAIMFFGLIWVIAPQLALVLMVMLPVFMFIAWRSSSVMHEAGQEERKTSQNRDGLIAEMIQGRTTIKALALDRAMRPVWEESHAANIENSVDRGTKTDLYSNLGQSLSMVTSILLTTVGAIAILSQTLTMGSLIATNMLSGRLLGPLNQLVGQWRTFSQFLQSVDRLGECFNSLSERTESEITLNKPQGRIETEDLTYSYGTEEKPVVDHVSVKIQPRGIHALVGRNGSGKTTLLKLLQGLYTAQNGRVLLDGADISQFSRAELAQWLGYVPQECVLFAGTVRENIVHRRPEADDDAVVKASQAAGVHHFIIDMPDGYATDIGEAGRRLSGGQRQRIAIARALVGDPPVLLLDEPSASLDRQAETELRKTLVEISKDRTVIIVTHSPILLAACDDLIALDRGKVALAGPARDILPRLFGQGGDKSADKGADKGADKPGGRKDEAAKAAAPGRASGRAIPPTAAAAPIKPGGPSAQPSAGPPARPAPLPSTPKPAAGPAPRGPAPTAAPPPKPAETPPAFRGGQPPAPAQSPAAQAPTAPGPTAPTASPAFQALRTHQDMIGRMPHPVPKPLPEGRLQPATSGDPMDEVYKAPESAKPKAPPPAYGAARNKAQRPQSAGAGSNTPPAGIKAPPPPPPEAVAAARHLPVLTTHRGADGQAVVQTGLKPKPRSAANDDGPQGTAARSPSRPPARPRPRPADPAADGGTESPAATDQPKRPRRRRRTPTADEMAAGAEAEVEANRKPRRRRRRRPTDKNGGEPAMRPAAGDRPAMREGSTEDGMSGSGKGSPRPRLGGELEDDGDGAEPRRNTG